MSTLNVTGKDISLMMDFEENNDAYPNQTDSVIVGQILAKYARYGIMPTLTPTTDVRMVTDGTSRQYETDLKCIQRLAGKNGFVFYVEPLSVGTSMAYWGPKTRSGVLQPALSIGMGTATNVKNLSFAEEGLSASSVKASYIEPFSKTVIPLPSIPPLRMPPLASKSTPSKKVTLIRDTANKGAAATLLEMKSSMMNQPDSVRGNGEVDTARYGHVLRARRMVGVRGAGVSYDGIYYVGSVSHRISRGGYTQSFSLSREGTGSLIPMVLP
jgi:phage protein D